MVTLFLKLVPGFTEDVTEEVEILLGEFMVNEEVPGP